jgi:hypothetical protein
MQFKKLDWDVMKEKKGANPLHQSEIGKLKFEIAGKSKAVDFADQRISIHAGTATFLRGSLCKAHKLTHVACRR